MRFIQANRDLLAGILVALAGAGTVLEGHNLTIGTLQEIGPGFFPMLLGVGLLVVGALIALVPIVSAAAAHRARAHDDAIAPPDGRGCLAIVAGVLSFIVLGAEFGMIPATFACVFIASRGDRTSTWRESLALAAILTAGTVGLFWYALQVPFPLLQWFGE